MDATFKNRMVGYNSAREIWKRIETYFASQTNAKVKQLKTLQKAIKKQGPTSKYLLKIKKVEDSLAVVGSPISIEAY